MKSVFNIWYMDDGSLEGEVDILIEDFETVRRFGSRCSRAQPSVRTRLDDASLRIAVALLFGAPICAPHKCICGVDVDSSGIHGLNCRKSAGRHVQHSALNDLVKRALTSAKVPSRLEPSIVFV